MKKFTISFLILLCFTNISYAAPSYGTKMPDKNQFFMGGQTHLVFDRNLEQEHGEMKSLQHFMLISYGLTDWLSIDLKGGAGDIEHKPDIGDTISYPTYVGGGYGFRINFFESNNTRAVFGFQHISIHPYSQKINNVKHKAVLDDWQFSMLISHQIKSITPYFGTKWSRMDYIHWIDDVRNRKKSDLTKSVGLIAGIDIPANEQIWFNIEGQFIDVDAVSISVNFSF